MKARKTIISATLFLLLSWGAVQAASISWKNGTTPPAQWSIDPAKPSPSDVIKFSGPTKVYANACVGESNLGGTPQLSIDPVSKVILLWFKGPAPQFCTLIYMPVCGLEGDFGPLVPGDWIFTTLHKDLGFEIKFTVGAKGAYRVDHDAPGPAHDGATWQTAFLTLQDALAVAGGGDQVLVAEGTYKPDQGTGVTPGDREASFVLPEGAIVRGGYAGYGKLNPDARDVALYPTVLSGDLQGNDLWALLNLDDNSYHVVTGPAGSPAAVLDGFTIKSGHGDGLYPSDAGGGLYNLGGELKVANCTFSANSAVWGGGITNIGGALTLVNTQVIGNRALMLGGGLHNYGGDVILHNCRIVGNTASYADVAGGAAIYNLDGTLKVLDSTVADNQVSADRAISSFSWSLPGGTEIEVANSILFNGGNEIWSNNLGAVQVTYSDVKGGWVGTGNINADPLFVKPGVHSIEGEWIDGDYRLNGASPAIDGGSNAALPADLLDLDGDDNTAEQIPWDLDDEVRIEGTRVDMGAHEQLATKPGPGPGPFPGLTICIGGNCIVLSPDPSAPPSSYTYIGHTTLHLEMNFKGQLSAEVTATSAAGGMWTGWLVPDIVGPGDVTTELWVKGENLDIGALPGGGTNIQVAEVKLFVVPVP